MQHIQRYSPYAQQFYSRNGDGPGIWFQHDIATWNLVWLSVPQLDLYHNPLLDQQSIMATIDTWYMGVVVASLEPEVSECTYPHLRDILTYTPRESFMSTFLRGRWMDIPAYHDYGMKWIETMRSRALGDDIASTMQRSREQATTTVVVSIEDYLKKVRNRG